ncbi:hypothetical protein O3G_MSEX000076 [Manduca sexta]|nr:hypothetical protein O3G_MSEX000076 [Manduca sexta]
MPRTRRQSRRQSDFVDADEAAAAASPSPQRSFSCDDVAAMIASLQRSQAETLERLFDHMKRTQQREPSSSVLASTPTVIIPAPGNFSACTVRFGGAPSESVDTFLDAVEAFKECAADISEVNAVRGLSMLLTNDAATWWQGVKSSITTWIAAVQGLRSAFGDTRPPHRIYRELFSRPQDNEKTEIFIAKARSLLARLPQDDINEKVELDMVYGLLHIRIRKRLRQEEFSSFNTLLKRAREIEEAVAEIPQEERPRPSPRSHKHADAAYGTAGPTPSPPAANIQNTQFADPGSPAVEVERPCMVTMNSADSGRFTIASHAGAGKLPVISSAPLGVGELPTITSRPFRVNDVPAIVPEDPDVLKIIRDLEADDELASNRWLERGYMMSQGILYRYDPDGDSEEIQLVVPVSKREEILKEFHDSPTAGHQRVTRTLNRLRERYFFPVCVRFESELSVDKISEK